MAVDTARRSGEPSAARLVGIDVGGTFTDVVVRDEDDGAIRVTKVPSTPRDQAIGFMEGLDDIVDDPSSVALLIHGTTVATNAVIERKGATCLLVTTRGFRDVIELGRRDRPHVYGLHGQVTPLITRDRRIEVEERVAADGEILQPVDASEVIEAVRPYADAVEAVVVSFLHGYLEPANELAACDAIRAEWPDVFVISAGEALPQTGEFERTSTAIAHAYVQPIMSRYLNSLAERVAAAGYERPPAVIQCNGGIMALDHAVHRPGQTVRSGPAAGVIAGAALAREAGFPDALTADLGGTSFDVALVVDGQPMLASEKLIDFRIPLRIPTIDVETIGAGGGSIARLDESGILEVGPESAGSDPGPACYGRGGQVPTVTDANIVLGRINATRPIGGTRLTLDPDLSRAVILEEIARPLGIGVEEAAEAILRVIDNRMAGQSRIMTVGRGYDPADFTLVAFGGGGPLHGAAIMAEVGLARVLVPPGPGVTSALGCIEADVQYDFSTTVRDVLDEADMDAINRTIGDLQAQGRELVEASGIPVSGTRTVAEAEMLYQGQQHTIAVPLELPMTREAVAAAFAARYERQYGMTFDARPVITDIRCRVIGERPRHETDSVASARQPWTPAAIDERPVYVAGDWQDAVVIERDRLEPGMYGEGPALIEQLDTTTFVPPGMSARADEMDNVVMEPTP